MTPLHFPDIDPVAIRLGPLAIRWYAISYIAGILIGWRHVRKIAAAAPKIMSETQVDDLVVWCTLGVVLGGRLGYVLFYQPSAYLADPVQMVAVWHGGMSFHAVSSAWSPRSSCSAGATGFHFAW
jgi:phosphatidylglycerol---prolipoprotein diacylglyceryl transferase